MRLQALVLSFLVVAGTAQERNPASFTCDEHYQRFVRSGTIARNGRCYDVYQHASPSHRIELLCK
jgi:hypothetical protein